MKTHVIKYSLFFLLLPFSFTLLSNPKGFAQAKQNTEVKISLEELKKLLNLDANEISLSWEEFRQLVGQTGEKIDFPYTVKNGKVILPRKQFKQLLDNMKPPLVDIVTPPADYIITKAEYQGHMDEHSATFTVLFYLEVFEKEQESYRKIPFLPQSVALTEVLLNDEPALVLEENGWYHITTAESGQHLIKVTCFAPHNLKKGPQILSLPIIKTAITLFELEIPLEEVDIDIPNAKELTISQESGKTSMSAVLPATDMITVNVHRKYISTEEAEQEEEIPAKIYAETINLLSIEEDALRVHSRIKLNVLQKPINFIEAKVPEEYSILYVRKSDGTELRDWQTHPTKTGVLLRIPFDAPLEGNDAVNIVAERLFEDEKTFTNFNGFEIIGAIRETGFLGAEKKSTAEAIPTEHETLDPIDIQNLPYELIKMSERPLLFGFRYLRHPFNLVMSITKHEELPMMSTVIDMASVITVVLEDGKQLTKVVYTMRNTWKQFLELELPPDSEIWTVYVAGKRENASKSTQGKFMVPLTRSAMQGEMLQSFTVDLMYYTKGRPLSFFSSRVCHFPTADVMISKMLWSVYLPQEFRYLRFSGNVEKEEMAGTWNLISGKRRDFNLGLVDTYKKVAQNIRAVSRMSSYEQSTYSEFDNRAIRQSDIAVQMMNEANLDQMIQGEKQKGIGQPGSGGDIFRIELPTSGQIYRFNKTVIEGEPIKLRFYYASGGTMTVLKTLFGLIILLVIIRYRKGIFAFIRLIYRWLAARQTFWNFIRTKAGMRVTLFGATILCFFLAPILFIVFTLLFLVSVFRPNWLLKTTGIGNKQE